MPSRYFFVGAIMGTLAPFRGDTMQRATAWSKLEAAERKRRASLAANERDIPELVELTIANMLVENRSGANLSPHTRSNYATGIKALVEAWPHVNLLRPDRRDAAIWVRQMERDGKAPATVTCRLAAARSLYRALRDADATDADPFKDVRPALDKRAIWDKRRPYSKGEVDALLRIAEGSDRLLILLAAHAGLRNMEIVALRWEHIDWQRRLLTVVNGKGRKTADVPISQTLYAALHEAFTGRPDLREYVITEYRTTEAARNHIRFLCTCADVEYKGIHALRHYCGTELQRQTRDIHLVARHLRHSSVSTSEGYIHLADEALQSSIGNW